MKRLKACAGIALAVILVWLCALAQADASGISVVRTVEMGNQAALLMEVRLKDNAGRGVRATQQSFRFTGPEGIELPATPVGTGSNGYIVVVDTSMYYYGNKSVKIEHIRDMAIAYLSRLGSDARVMFVLASDAQVPTCTTYMTADQARDYVSGITMGTGNSANISTAICNAFRFAQSPAADAPQFNSVFIIADPDQESNQGDSYTLADCADLYAQGGQEFDVVVAIPYREQFFKNAADARRQQLNNGISMLENLARQCGGTLVEVPQTNQGVSTESLHTELTWHLETSAAFLIDLTPLAGHVPTDPQIQSVEVTVTSGSISRSVTCRVDTALLPEPEAAPTATPEVVPEATEVLPTPVVVREQKDDTAMQAVFALRQLGYLDKSSVDSFDNDCYLAYLEFCKVNGIDPRDGIYADTLALMNSDKALPKPQITPVPTDTPAPTPIVGLGQSGGEAGTAIRMLRKLNYLTVEGVTAFDDRCFEAYIAFCNANGLDPRDGIYEEGMALLKSGDAVAAPAITPEPTATPVPTVPPEGYAINAQDTEDSGGYIAKMQTILKNLNCYGEESANVGRLDQATVNAVNRYCEAFNWRNDHPSGVSGAIVNEILTNGEKLKPLETPEPTLQERIRAFLMSGVQLGSLTIPNWALVILGVVLVILLAVVLIVTGRSRKADQPQQPVPVQQPAAGQADPAGGMPMTPGTGYAMQGDTEMTVGTGYMRYLTLEISYGGQVQTLRDITLSEGRELTFGRRDAKGRIPDPDIVLDSGDKSLSRGRHAVLRLHEGSVYLHDESSFHNTSVHNTTVYDHEQQYGVLLSSGDEITMSAHTVRVSW